MNHTLAVQPSNQKPVVSFRLVAAISVIDGVFFGLSNPGSNASGVLIIAGIALLAVGIFAWSGLLIRLAALFWPFGLRAQRRLVIFATAISLALILMQSIGQLSWRDVLTFLPLALALYIYIAYLSAGSTHAV
jgi:hypothetical protein